MTASATRQTRNGRPVLSLPGFRKADHQPAPATAAPKLPSELVALPELPRLLTADQHATLMTGLAAALGAAVGDIPVVFAGLSPKPLAIGLHEALLAGYPNADAALLSPWLATWTTTAPYLYRVSMGGPRYGLDGQLCGEVTKAGKWHAKLRLKQLREQESQPSK